MVKIKQKKQLNLPQLIQWAMDNEVENSIFIGKKNFYNVSFYKNGFMYFNTTKPIPTGELFTVEVEEIVTEDTEFENLVYIDKDNQMTIYMNFTINRLKDEFVKDFHAYIDGEFKLIWRDGKLVE